jgi:anti-anti-sigma factor
MRSESASGNQQGPLFDVRLIQTEDEITVAVYGDVDLATCTRLWSVMERAIALGPRLVLDLRGTTFIGATAVDLIVRAHHRLGGLREPIAIRSPAPAARRVLTLTGVDQLVTIEDAGDLAPDTTEEER